MILSSDFKPANGWWIPRQNSSGTVVDRKDYSVGLLWQIWWLLLPWEDWKVMIRLSKPKDKSQEQDARTASNIYCSFCTTLNPIAMLSWNKKPSHVLPSTNIYQQACPPVSRGSSQWQLVAALKNSSPTQPKLHQKRKDVLPLACYPQARDNKKQLMWIQIGTPHSYCTGHVFCSLQYVHLATCIASIVCLGPYETYRPILIRTFVVFLWRDSNDKPSTSCSLGRCPL